MKKLVTMLVFLAITGLATACGASPVDLPDDRDRSNPSPNGLYDGR